MPTEPPKQDNYETALRLGWQKLAEQDLEKQAARCQAEIQKGKDDRASIALPFFSKRVLVSPAERAVRYIDENRDAPTAEAILILHYLASQDEIPPAGEPIAFSQVPAGKFYEAAFNRRTNGALWPLFQRVPAGSWRSRSDPRCRSRLPPRP